MAVVGSLEGRNEGDLGKAETQSEGVCGNWVTEDTKVESTKTI